MAPISRSTFRDRIQALDRDAFTAFVADLWDARGFETRVDGDVLIATRTGGTTARELIAIDPEGAPGELASSSTVDVVVTRAPEVGHGVWPAARVLGCGHLHEVLLYAVPRAAADIIVRRHLDCELPFEPSGATTPASGGIRAAVPTPPAWLAVGSVVLLAVLVAVAIGAQAPGFGTQGAADVAGPGTTQATLTAAPTPGPGTTVADSGAGVPCLDTPDEAMQYQLGVLGRDGGVRSLWEFGTHEFRRYAGTYREFNHSMHSHPFEHLRTPAGIANETLERSGAMVREAVTTTGEDGEQHSYVFTLARVDENGYGCWRTDGLTYARSE